jgi:hypothetical protein
MYALREFINLEIRAGRWAGRWAWKLVTAPFLLIWWFVKSFGLAVAATPGILWRLPVRGYRRLMRLRDWLLVKVEFLQAESAKWKTTFAIVKSPFTLLTKMGFSPNMAASLLIGSTALTTGVVVNETLLAEPSFAAGDPGQYDAPNDAPILYDEAFNTLKVSLGTTPVKVIEISSVTAGTAFLGSALPQNATTAIDIGGDASADTWLIVGSLEFTQNRCDTLVMKNITTHELTISDNLADGQSISSSAAAGIRNRAVLGGHGMAQAMRTESGLYDRIHVTTVPNATGSVDSLILNNIWSVGGQCRLNRIKAGSITVSLNVIGGDNSLVTKAFQVEDTVKASVITLDSNIEQKMGVGAIQTMDD